MLSDSQIATNRSHLPTEGQETDNIDPLGLDELSDDGSSPISESVQRLLFGPGRITQEQVYWNRSTPDRLSGRCNLFQALD